MGTVLTRNGQYTRGFVNNNNVVVFVYNIELLSCKLQQELLDTVS
jgi:hypothetical protein